MLGTQELGALLEQLVEIPSESTEAGSGHRRAHPCRQSLLALGWGLLVATAALQCGGEAEGKVFCLSPFQDVEYHFSPSRGIPQPRWELVWQRRWERQAGGEAPTRSSCGSLREVMGSEKPSTNNCNFLSALRWGGLGAAKPPGRLSPAPGQGRRSSLGAIPAPESDPKPCQKRGGRCCTAGPGQIGGVLLSLLLQESSERCSCLDLPGLALLEQGWADGDGLGAVGLCSCTSSACVTRGDKQDTQRQWLCQELGLPAVPGWGNLGEIPD